MKHVDAAEAHAMLHDGQPLAPLDLREAGQFGEGHPLFAMPLPYSRLEQLIADLVPRRAERVLLMDRGDGIAEKAAHRLKAAGYRNVFVLAGGVPAWAAAGYGVFKGVNVPSKVLGELAEALWHPDVIAPETLAGWQAGNRPHRLFDARPGDEYARMRIPGAACLPNGELPHRIAALNLPEGMPVAITCAGRTRGIVGAIGLRLAGHAGPIHALENGTQGWALAGLALERGNEAQNLPALDDAAQAASRQAAGRLIKRLGIAGIDRPMAEAMLCDSVRTTYLLDVRSREEAEADPVPGAVHAPGGQLVQATDQWLAVRHARVILCCDTGLRSALAAFWLHQLGYESHLLPLAEARNLKVPERQGVPIPAVGSISARFALSALSKGARLIDLRSSSAYREGHVAGATWGIRPKLAQLVGSHAAQPVLLIADSVQDAALAAVDLAEAGVSSVRRIEGGHDAMRQAGAAIDAGPGWLADSDCIDYLFFVHDRHSGNLDAARRYLAWETGLVEQLSPAEQAEFRLIAPEAS